MLFARALVVLATCGAWLAFVGAVAEVGALRQAPTATATVTAVDRDSLESDLVEVRFTTVGGRDVHTDLRWHQRPRPKAGDTGAVLYHPSDPLDTVRDLLLGRPSYSSTWLNAAAAIVLTGTAAFSVSGPGRHGIQPLLGWLGV